MTYNQIITRLLQVMDSHLLINETGYGNLSDIHTPEDEKAPSYPYAFLNPVNVVVGAFSFDIQLNLIIMDQLIDGEGSQAEEIKVQSNCLMYLQDIISHFRQLSQGTDRHIDIDVDVTATPFKERFEDNVAGIGAQITITAISPLEGCDAAFPS